jgi:polar amino acid transport system permease protein
MTSAAEGGAGSVGTSHSTPPGGAIVDQIAQADARRKTRFRLVFAATWIALVGGLVLLLIAVDAVDLSFLSPWWRFIVAGVPLTIFISVVSIFLAVIFALLGAMGRISASAPIYAAATLYISLVRGTPLIVQIIFIWAALPQIWRGFAAVDLIWLGIFALAFNYGAYMTEIFRAGIQAVPRGQREAAAALGLAQRRIMTRIVLPQAIKIVTPAIGNEFIAMIKDSALVSIIGVHELLWRARTVGQPRFHVLETLLLAAAMYWILTMIFSYFQERLEQRMAKADR